LIGPDPHKPLPHPVIWLFENVTMTIVRLILTISLVTNYLLRIVSNLLGKERSQTKDGKAS